MTISDDVVLIDSDNVMKATGLSNTTVGSYEYTVSTTRLNIHGRFTLEF